MGIAHVLTAASVNVTPGCLPLAVEYAAEPEPRESCAVAVGHSEHEEPFPSVRRANVGRAETRPLRIEPERGQIPENGSEAVSNDGWHVLQEDEPRSHVANDAEDKGPEPSLVFESALRSSDAEWLARKPGSDEIHAATEEFAREGFEIVEDRRAIQGRIRHPRHESARRVGVPLDVTHAAVASADSSGDSKLESSNPGA